MYLCFSWFCVFEDLITQNTDKCFSLTDKILLICGKRVIQKELTSIIGMTEKSLDSWLKITDKVLKDKHCLNLGRVRTLFALTYLLYTVERNSDRKCVLMNLIKDLPFDFETIEIS